MNTSHEWIFWLATMAYALHVMEEFTFDWKTWATKVLKFEVDWPLFYVTNAAVIVSGICIAMIGWKVPEISLSYPALMLINATFFHVLPVIRTRQFSPGLLTALVLFFPIGIAAYAFASMDNQLTAQALIISALLGCAFMIYPLLLIKLRPRLANYHYP